jgi:hypothetical protein
MYQGAPQLVDRILRNPGMAFGAIAEGANGYDLSRQRRFNHPDLAGTRVWIQNTGTATSGDYFFAYAGKPALTPSGTTVAYTEPVPPAPAVVGRYPSPGATGISAAVQPAVQFDRVVSGVSASSFTLKRSNGTTVGATVTNNGNSKQFTLHPSAALTAGLTYTLSLTSAIKSAEGGSLAPVSWSFTVAGTSPPAASVVGRYPGSGATGVSAAVQPAVQFDRVVVGVSASSFTLKRSNGTVVTASVTNNGNSKQFTLHPSAALQAGMSYTLSVTSAVMSSEGVPMAPVSWSFTVAGS